MQFARSPVLEGPLRPILPAFVLLHVVLETSFGISPLLCATRLHSRTSRHPSEQP